MLCDGESAAAEIPTTELLDGDFEDGAIGVIQALVKAGLVASNGEARRAITQGGVRIGDRKVTDVFEKLKKDELAKGETILARGKKSFKKLIVK